MTTRLKVGIDLAPIAFRKRAPGTATLVEHQARALLALDVDWDWVFVATPRVLADSPFFQAFNPIVVSDKPLSYHVPFRLGRLWAKASCALGLSTAFFSPLFGPPVVTNYFDANAFHPVRDTYKLRDQIRSKVVQGLWRMSRARARSLFILSDYGRRRMIEVDPVNASKWIVAPCGVSPIATTPKTPRWASRLNEKPFILYAGAFSENKNQRRLIAAWDQLQQQHPDFPALVLIGPCPADYRRDVIEPAIAKTSHPNKIVVPGFVSQEEAAWAFRRAHAYVQPSFAEGFGMPIVEAMSCGIPTACSNSTSLPEVAGDAAILFNPSGIEDLANTLQALVFDESLRNRLRLAGFARCKLFTWSRHAEVIAASIRGELAQIGQN